ncbi:MAG: S8 family serine peptidase [Flavobacteriales bacterium]|nr:S8 family serine peptidase [Flavobacteriales bacterium]
MRNYILCLLVLSCFSMTAQQLQKVRNLPQQRTDTTKYATAINAIIASYDQNKLSQQFQEASERELLNKEIARSYALLHNIPLKKYNEDGSFSELQKITANGIPIYYEVHNVDAAISTRANYLNTGGGLGLTVDGDDMTAHVWDGGPTRPTHQEFDGAGGNNRVAINDGVFGLNGNSFHAQHVTGTIVASGFIGAAKGMAWQGNALTHDWNNDLSEATNEAANGMLLSNHSYGYQAPSIPNSWFGQYGSDARDWDALMYSAPYYLQIKSAGNDGNDNTSNASPLDGQSGYDKLNGDACAKNNLVIANAQDASINPDGSLNSVTKNSSSSEGPTDDYRIKPDIAGNGTGLYSTYDNSDSAYNSISGTSMAAPNVTGTLLLLQEHYNNVNSVFMKAATLKGLALHTADDAGTSGPDAHFGWGLLNAKKAAEAITDAATNSAIISELTLNQGQTYQITIQSDGVSPLLASISWTDPAGTVNNGTNSNTPALVNDLDVRLNNGTTYTPWRLTGVTTNGTGDNEVDPYERIDITSGATGQYVLTVTHKGSLSGGSQDFSLIVTGGVIAAATPEISFGTTTAQTTEGSDCSYTDINIPVNIGQAPSANADVNFTVAGGTALDGIDATLLTPQLTFPTGSVAPQNIIIRVYEDGFIESDETFVVDFTVNANGGDATANTNADSVTVTITDDDSAPPVSDTYTLSSYDMEDTTGWQGIDADGDGNAWILVSGLSYTGIEGTFFASETDLTILTPTANPPNANPNNYVMSPIQSIPASTTNVSFSFGIGGYQNSEYYAAYWTTDISNEAAITSGILLSQGNTPNGAGAIITVNESSIAGQDGYFVVRHYNSDSNNGLLLFDTLTIDLTVDTSVQTATNSATSDETNLPTSGSMFMTDSSSGALMAEIDNNSTHDYGCVEVYVSRAGTGAQAYNGSTSPNLVMDKVFTVNRDNLATTGDVTITFYFTEAEVSGWETATSLNRTALVAAREDGGFLAETSNLTIGSFGAHVTLTGTFTELSDTFYFGPSSAFIACPGVAKIWNGVSWLPPGDPTSLDAVTIDGDLTLATNDLEACTLIINAGNTVTVTADQYLRVNGDITLDGSLIVEHQGSVVQVDPSATVTKNAGGVINVEVTTPVLSPRDFMLMGTPMSAETREGVYTDAFLVLDFTPQNFIPHPLVPAGGTNFADDDGDFYNEYSGGLTVGEGYLVRPQTGYSHPTTESFDMTYTLGTLNNGNISHPAIFNNITDNPDGTPNIFGNPYPSAISANDFINGNPLINEVYFWEHLTPPSSSFPGANPTMNFSMDDLSMYNLSGGTSAANDPGTSTEPNGVISTAQGFAVKVFSGGNVNFTNSMRLTTGNTTLRQSANNDLIDKIWLKLANTTYELGSNTLIAFNPLATPDIDPGYDSERISTNIGLYSLLEVGENELGIQTRDQFEDGMKIRLGFSTQIAAEEQYTISLSDLEGIAISEATVYLIDTYENVITNLTMEPYSFRSNKGVFNNRFVLQFKSDDILNNQEAALEMISVFPNPTRDRVHVVSPQIQIDRIEVLDMQGRTIQQLDTSNQSTHELDLSALRSAIYFVTISTKEGSVTKKLIKE